MNAVATLPAHGVLTCDDLRRATGYDRVGDLRRALDQAGIRYFLGRGGAVWTTIDLVNAAGGLAHGLAQNEPFDPDGFKPTASP